MALLVEAIPSLRPEELFAMDALLAMEFLAGKLRLAQSRAAAVSRRGHASGGEAGDGTWQDLGGGKRAYRIKSMDTLYGLMRSRGGVL